MALTLEDMSYRLLPRVRAGRALGDSEWRTLVTVAETLLEGCPVEIDAERVADNVERFLTIGRSRRAWRVRVLLTLVEYLPLARYGAPFSDLPKAVRQQLVSDRFIDGHMLWGVCAKVRMLVMMGAYGDVRAQAAVGFVPVPLRARHQPRVEPSVTLGAAS